MSSQRRKLDQYFTEARATYALLDYVSVKGRYIFECCNGAGDISKLLAPECVAIKTNDIDPTLEANYHLDAAVRKSWEEFPAGADWTISNPPFNLASQIIPLAFDYSVIGISMLLRGSYTEPTFDRQDWLKAHERHLAHIIYLPRISFTGDGKTDNVSCNWYVWTKERVGGCQLHWVTKERR